jgi:hypothetical protein
LSVLVGSTHESTEKPGANAGGEQLPLGLANSLQQWAEDEFTKG